MRIFRVLFAGGLVVLCALFAAAMVAEKPKSHQTLGERVDSAVGVMRQEAGTVAEQLRRGYERARIEVDNLGTNGRVYARLRWDKTLAGATVYIEVQEGGLVVLRGTVPNKSAKSRAVELARDTVGVARVTDELKVAVATGR